jgi:hypothetical protein
MKMIAAMMVTPLVAMKHWMWIANEEIKTIRPEQVSNKYNVVAESLQNV